jgi:hypothetical protein
MAEPQPSTDNKTQKPNCLDNWPPPKDSNENKWLVKAFEIALQESAMPGSYGDPGPTMRRALLDTRNNFASPTEEIHKILKREGHDMELPRDLVIIFYEQEPSATPTPTPTGTPKENKGTAHPHPNHCYLVLYLDPVGTATPKSFQSHVMCCYDPYQS